MTKNYGKNVLVLLENITYHKYTNFIKYNIFFLKLYIANAVTKNKTLKQMLRVISLLFQITTSHRYDAMSHTSDYSHQFLTDLIPDFY